ncbi:DUF2300 domain-containing protein [Escherichia coli]
MAVALPKGHFPAEATAQAGAGERYDQTCVCYPTTALAAGERHAQPASYYPKRKPGWRKKCRSGGVYYKARRVQRTRRVCGLSGQVSPIPIGSRKRLFIRNFFTLQDRLDLTHEYLHLAFDGYPTGLDENYIETLTRQLLMD